MRFETEIIKKDKKSGLKTKREKLLYVFSLTVTLCFDVMLPTYCGFLAAKTKSLIYPFVIFLLVLFRPTLEYNERENSLKLKIKQR